MTRKTITLSMVLALAVFGFVACQKAQEAGEKAAATTEDAGAAAAEMGGEMAEEAQQAVENLSAEAQAQYDEISAKLDAGKEKLAELEGKISGMSPQDLLDGDGKALKDEAEQLKTEIGELEEKLKALVADATSTD